MSEVTTREPPVLGGGAWLADRMLSDRVAKELIDDSIVRFDLPEVDFRSRARLHLPILYRDFSSPSRDHLGVSIERLAGAEAKLLEPFRSWHTVPAAPEYNLRHLTLRPLSETESVIIFSRFHYIRSKRLNSQYFGLSYGSHIAAAAALSPYDLYHLGALPGGIAPRTALVLSRVYSFRGAPENTLSFLLGRMAELAANSGAEILLTYLNPNLGFTGASYRAANWTLLAYECGTRYQYIDSQYVTDRDLIGKYGTDNPMRLSQTLGTRLQVVHYGLAPLKIFAYYTDPKDRSRFADLSPRAIRRLV